MSLVDQAILDVAQILEGDFSSEILMIAPTGEEATLQGIHAKHHLGVNPDTGQAINSKKASVTIAESALIAANPDYPIRVNDEVSFKNHRIRVKDSTGGVKKYKAEQWFPDETVGLIVIILSFCAD